MIKKDLVYSMRRQTEETFGTEVRTRLKLSAALNAYIYMEKIKDVFKKNDAFYHQIGESTGELVHFLFTHS